MTLSSVCEFLRYVLTPITIKHANGIIYSINLKNRNQQVFQSVHGFDNDIKVTFDRFDSTSLKNILGTDFSLWQITSCTLDIRC